MVRFLASCGVLCSAICGLAVPLVADDNSPTQVVARWQAAILDTMEKASSLGYEGRVERLASALDETHDLARMARDRVGKSWEGFTEEQRDSFTSLYRRAKLADLARRLDRYRGESFEQLAEKAEGDVVVVQTVRVLGEGKRAYDYRLRQLEGSWRIIDVITNGSSERERTSIKYQELIRTEGFEGLLAQLKKVAHQADETPRQVVTRFQESVIAVMKQGSTLGYQGRFEKLEPLLKSTHDLTGMAQMAVRAFWTRWSTSKKKQYVKLFRELSVAHYASKLKTYGGEAYAFRGEQQAKSSAVVRATVTRTGGKKRKLDYFLRKVKGKWRILSISADGTSEFAAEQAAYTKILSNQEFPALLERIRSRIRRLESAGQ